MVSRAGLILIAIVACDGGRSQAQPRRSAPTAAAMREAGADWDRATARIEAERVRLAAAARAAKGAAARARVRDEASRVLVAAIRDELAPPWLGMPWGLGRNSTATRPFEPGHVVGCSYFVGSVLRGAGFRLRDRFELAQAPALVIQRSLVGTQGKVHRFTSIPPAALAARLAALGDGVYVIGLNVHVGLVTVRGDDVRFVHASYTGRQEVADEPLAESIAIANSQARGYFVSPLVVTDGAGDDWLVDRWLAGAAVGPGDGDAL